MFSSLIKSIVPAQVKDYVKAKQNAKLREYVASLPKINEDDLGEIITQKLGIREGDTVFIHSSMERLNITFPFYNTIGLLRKIVGESGTILFPTYPKVNSYKFLLSGDIFDVRKTPSYTGLLTEFARRASGAVRSIHPAKSVCAIGKNALELTKDHSKSLYPYDEHSPYYKLTQMENSKIIGLGVKSTYLSCVHVVDDAMKENFPVNPYHDTLFKAKCKDYNGEIVIVNTYAHDMNKMNFSLPDYMQKYIDKSICKDVDVDGMNFFRADAKRLISRMTELAEKNITIYKRYHYKLGRIL